MSGQRLKQRMTRGPRSAGALMIVAGLLLNLTQVAASNPQKSKDEWPAYGRDGGGSRYSPAAQITRANVNKLRVVWTYHTGAIPITDAGFKSAFEATPILADGVLYLCTPFNRVVALDPQTGAERWAYDPKIDPAGSYSEVTSRGVSIWRDARSNERRIFVATIDARLIALDATTGQPCKAFGQDGQVDLTRDVRLTDRGQYQVTSPPAVIGDLLVVGSSIGDNRGVEIERGVVRAYDVHTGQLRWSWDPIPKDAKDPARQGWQGDSALHTGAANAWSIISVDERRGLIFVPTGSPSPDFYGGERKGDNRYANSVVALRAATGQVVWHFQVVHHDLWDYDVAAQPMLMTIKRRGGSVDAVAVGTKIGHLFLLDRDTGKPLFPVEERAVPQTNVAGEQTSPTQPFPTLPHAIVPQRLTPDDVWGITPADQEACRERLKKLRSEGVFTPPSIEGTLIYPGNVGGMNWSGMAYDAARNLIIFNTNRLATVVRLIPREEYTKMRATPTGERLGGEFGQQKGTPYAMHREPFLSPSGAPCNAPPWGALSAVDAVTGELRWEVPLGTIPQLGRFPKSSEWGSLNVGGAVVTAGGLVFIAAAMDNYLRAFDVETGKELWRGELPASAQAAPMTYEIAGKQYVVICAGGHGKLGTKRGDAVIAFALP